MCGKELGVFKRQQMIRVTVTQQMGVKVVNSLSEVQGVPEAQVMLTQKTLSGKCGCFEQVNDMS